MKLITYILQKLSPSLFLRNSRTVRYAFSFMLLATLSVAVASSISTTRSYVELTSKQKTDTTHTVSVYAVAQVAVNAVEVVVAIPNGFEVISVDRGRSVITLWTKDPDVRDGKVYIEGGTYRRGFIGRHLLVDIELRAKSEARGTATVERASFLAGDGSGSVVATALRPYGEVILASETAQQIAKEVTPPKISTVDINGDGSVTLPDISIFMTEWVKQNNRYDFNNDGQTTIRDFSILLSAMVRN